MPNTYTRATKKTHEQVLSSAIHLFTEQGYFNTSVPDIVRESGVSTGSIYHNFGDKAGIAKALFDMSVERMETEFNAIERQFDTSRARCKAVIELLFQITEEEPEVMAFMLFTKHKEFMPDMAPVCSSRPFKQMRNMVSDGMATGEVRQMDDIVAASAIFGGALRMINLQLDGVLEHPLGQYMDEIWGCAWLSVTT